MAQQNWLSSNLKVGSLMPGCPWERHWIPNCSCCIHWCISVSVWKKVLRECLSKRVNVAYTKKALWVFRIAKQQVSASPFIILMVVSFIHICVRLSHNKLVFHGVLALWSLKSWPVTWNQPVLLAQGDYFYLLWPHYLITWLCLMWVSTLNIGEKIWKLSRSHLSVGHI